MGRNCQQYLVVEHNGDIYPCDFFVEPQLRLGNVLDTSWEACFANPVYQGFGQRKVQWNEACQDCEFLDLCAGDCPKNRYHSGHRAPAQLSVLCAGIKKFYQHSLPEFNRLAGEIKQQRAAEERQRQAAVRAPLGKVGRNDPCPCGSGKKFKRCCGR
jgi:uncharacterized protein